MPDKIIVDVDNFPATAKAICAAAGKCGYALSLSIGLSKNNYYAWSSGRTLPQLFVFARFAEAAGYRVVLEKVEEDA